MQLQIECRSSSLNRSVCCLCDQSFEVKEARVIVCDEQGTSCGEVCCECIHKGFGWLNDRFSQLNAPMKSARKHRIHAQKSLLIGA
jgi:predicted amidophosphoribosyltransferase